MKLPNFVPQSLLPLAAIDKPEAGHGAEIREKIVGLEKMLACFVKA